MMDYFRRFTFLFATPAFDADDLEGVASTRSWTRSAAPASRW